MAEVFWYCTIKKRFQELNEQMEVIKDKMVGLQTQQRQCVTRLGKANALRHIDKECGQDIRLVSSWQYECGACSD